MTFKTRFFLALLMPLLSAFIAVPSLSMASDINGLSTPESPSDFLAHHWPKKGIPLQGKPPEDFSPLEASLHPEKCGLCHPQPFKDWKGSRHAQAMGIGVLAQIIPMLETEPESAQPCFRCHTPLSEQQNKVQNTQGAWQKNTRFDARLQHQGLVCAGCHVRQWQRFGPPRKTDIETTGEIGKNALPHHGFSASKAFLSSAFCKSCHQFDHEGYSLNGKPLENTYQEWLDSDYAKQGVQCQNCHMPDRRHLWRGIHDKETVRQGIDIKTQLNQPTYRQGDTVTAAITIKNSGVGHHFPTYLTPQVVVRAYLLNAQGTVQAGSQQESFIGRGLSEDMSAELYDTRIPAGDSLTVQYQQTLHSTEATLRIEIDVEPDYFYESFFQERVAQSEGAMQKSMQAALTQTQQSSYRLYERSLPLHSSIHPNPQPKALAEPSLQSKPIPQQPTNTAHDNKVDWNESALKWYGYQEALKQAKTRHQPILFILYADWCPVCHAYSTVFYDKRMIAATQGFILARANVDEQPQLSQKFDLDGEYVPRTFILNPQGDSFEAVYGNKKFPRYFIPAEATDEFLMRLNQALKAWES